MTEPDAPSVIGLLQQIGADERYELVPLSGGGNNRVFRVVTPSSTFLLKCYFRHPGDERDRLGTEFAFLSFAWRQGIRCVPRPFALDADQGLGLYEFVEGQAVCPGEVDAAAVREALRFYRELNEHRHLPTARRLAAGSEACFRLADHLHCVERRLARLARCVPVTDVDRQAEAFVFEELTPRWNALRERTEGEARALGIAANDVLPDDRRCLSPSDFGFHNALVEPSGAYRFVDFEYAGWDDPARMACDFFCQPAVPVPHEHWQLFVDELTANQVDPASERRRMELLLPIYRMKWVTILLNDFVDAGNQRRRFARAGEDAEERKAKQLDKARTFLDPRFCQ